MVIGSNSHPGRTEQTELVSQLEFVRIWYEWKKIIGRQSCRRDNYHITHRVAISLQNMCLSIIYLARPKIWKLMFTLFNALRHSMWLKNSSQIYQPPPWRRVPEIDTSTHRLPDLQVRALLFRQHWQSSERANAQ